MLYVTVFSISVAVAGMVMLFLLTRRAFRQVKQLGSTVAAASSRIAEASADLEMNMPRERS